MEGSGTASDPYEITNATQLQAMENDLDAHYVLVEDVDASATAGWNGGAGFDPIGTSGNEFSGTFNGNGYTIDGVTIDRSGVAIGLFGSNSGTITNVSLANVAFTGDPDTTVGGVVGVNVGVVSKSSVASGVVEGGHGGGIAGEVLNDASVSDSYANATVTAQENAGGLAGTNYGAISTSYATGVVTLGDTDDRVGGIVGYNQGSVSDSYWNQDSDGDATSGVGRNADTVTNVAGLSTGEMTGANATQTMNGLSFDSTWTAIDGDYPVLSSQVESYDLALANDEIAVDGGPTDATVTVTLRDGTTRTATTTSTYATGGNVSVAADGTVTADAYGPDTVTATAGGFSGAVAVTALDADYEVTFTDAPATVAAGESYWINATVENVGNDEGSDNVSLTFGNATIYDEPTTVPAGAAERIAVGYEIPEDTAIGVVALNATTPDDQATRSVHVNSTETLSGTVTDGVTGDALSGLTVTIDDGTSTKTSTTNASGAYSIEILNASNVSVSATTTMDWGEGAVAISGSNATTIDDATTLDLTLYRTLPGNGTESDPYRIDTAAELQTVSQNLSANYTLVGDVDASGTAAWNDGAGFEPIGQDDGRFSGTFDGDGNEIEGLTIDRPGEDNVGLFSETNGTIHDVALSNASVVGDQTVGGLVGLGHSDGMIRNATVSGDVRGDWWVGGLAGETYLPVTNASASANVNGSGNVGGLVGTVNSLAPIDRSWASGTVTGTDNGIGGLVGSTVGNPSITNSWASGDVIGVGATRYVGGLGGNIEPDLSNVSATGDVTAPDADNVGGLVGAAGAGEITNTWASGNVTGDEDVGGLIGHGYETSRSYATGTVTGNASVGGAIGYVSSYGSTIDVYWDADASGQNTSAGNATGLTTAQLTGAAANGSLTGFDFENTWTLTDGSPRLQAAVEGLDLSINDASLQPGDAATVTVALDLVGGETATATTVANYTVSDSSVVAVDEGAITAVGAGTATISATVAGVNDSVTISVDAPPSEGSDDDSDGPTTIDLLDDGPAAGIELAVENAKQGDVVVLDGETAGTDDGGIVTAGNASIDAIEIEMGQDRDFTLTATGGPEPPGEFGSATGTAPLGTLDIEHDLWPVDVESVTFTYTVPRAALEESAAGDGIGAAPEDVALHRLADGEWQRLSTTVTGGNDTQVTFQSVSPGFSTFTIGADAAVYEVAEFAAAETVAVGETVTATATVENQGLRNGTFERAVVVVDGTVVDTISVAVPSDGTATVNATHAFETAGTHELCLGGTCTSVTVAEETGGSSDSTDPGDRAEGDSGTDDSLPGFGVLVTLFAIALLAAVGRLRRE
ncbi:hypothetical protein GCM10028857_24090 [Salinarchaeum chitinilyticum]